MSKRVSNLPTWAAILLSIIVFLLVWQSLVKLYQFEPFILPAPAIVWQQLKIVVADGRLAKHSWVTISEVIPGLMLGIAVAAPLGYLLAKSPLAERLLSPYLIASQAIPVIAIAPLLTIWVRSAYWSRVLVAVLVVFFPVLMNVIAGVRGVPASYYELMQTQAASRWQVFWKLEMPASLPVLLAGVKIGATLSVIGTLVGEFVQPKSEGLGFLLITARYQFKTDLVFVVMATLAAMALCLYGLVTILEWRFLRNRGV